MTSQDRASRIAAVAAAIVAVAILVCAANSAYAADPKFPPLTGRIVDGANLLSLEDEAAIETELATLEGKSSDQLVVVTLPSLQGFTIEEFGYKLGRHWGIGQKEQDNGVLLIVAPNERKVRIEVGQRLEPILTDGLSKIIVTNAVLPSFRRGDFPGGIKAGVRDIKDVLLGDAEGVKERARGLGEPDGVDWVALLIIAIWLAIFLYILWRQTELARQAPSPLGRRRLRRRRSGLDQPDVIILPGGSGHWDGGWSGGGGSGGGWSGGGGTFSGGGASGSW
ncbi:MAG: TPM domain-containing protein [Hyphomicrobium sp.]|nr:TPM domain-containing protein [Hyphomicrobium sp.]